MTPELWIWPGAEGASSVLPVSVWLICDLSVSDGSSHRDAVAHWWLVRHQKRPRKASLPLLFPAL